VRNGSSGLALAGFLAVVPAPAQPVESCVTVDGVPAATSESLVVGMREQIAAGSREGLQKFLDTGQTLMLQGGNAVEVLKRNPEQGTILVRRGERQLSFWTLESGIACSSAEPTAPKP
jgi:hypothetical protein